MKFILMFFAWLCAGGCSCSSIAASMPDLVAPVTQFTEVSWPVPITNLPGFEHPNFVFGVAPVLTSTGGQGTTLDVRSREGDTLVGLGLIVGGNDAVSARVRSYAFPAGSQPTDLPPAPLSDVFDLQRSRDTALLPLPAKSPHLMLAGEGLVIQVDANGAGYRVAAIVATWTRPQ